MSDSAETLRAAASADSGPLRGLWLTVLTADVVEAVLTAGAVVTEGIGWIGVDLQHGALEVSDLPGLLRVCRVPVLARTASGDPAHLARVLDTGVAGVIVPGVGSGSEAAALVAACRVPPEGRRSTGASRSALVGGPARPLLLPMVETREGLAAVEEIAGCAGIDGVFVGPYDLSLSLGRPTVADPEVAAAISAVAAAARRHGILAGAFSGSRSLEPLLPPLDVVAVDTDVSALRLGLAELFDAP
ncbi:putative 2-dehydro-3-deoxyglucarate aldolase [Nostocoides japonicum T1-X7]|uniref:Putative 2-dehydro-3-deoxyglucarate aldolase n=1 Tax=Nostocoides japonicum T1-X7 TaxID=1194083 RepID=A0A077LUG4_9MICO|nr:aldolase/citrate lyase family protein [Tetrasphaera japonica]CCH77463.1 putative 2-dehydro-3-deoxyglucarate aldolase [Tetrasphaera japonica T1-X7]